MVKLTKSRVDLLLIDIKFYWCMYIVYVCMSVCDLLECSYWYLFIIHDQMINKRIKYSYIFLYILAAKLHYNSKSPSETFLELYQVAIQSHNLICFIFYKHRIYYTIYITSICPSVSPLQGKCDLLISSIYFPFVCLPFVKHMEEIICSYFCTWLI